MGKKSVKKKSNQKKREGWLLDRYHSFGNREYAEEYPAHIGGGKTPILPALPKEERWRAKWPDDFGTTPYTFGYNQDYPTPSDKQIIREIQIQKFAKQLASRLKGKRSVPKDTMMRHAQENNYMEEFKRALGDPKGYSLGHLDFPRDFKLLPLPRNEENEKYYDLHRDKKRKPS